MWLRFRWGTCVERCRVGEIQKQMKQTEGACLMSSIRFTRQLRSRRKAYCRGRVEWIEYMQPYLHLQMLGIFSDALRDIFIIITRPIHQAVCSVVECFPKRLRTGRLPEALYTDCTGISCGGQRVCLGAFQSPVLSDDGTYRSCDNFSSSSDSISEWASHFSFHVLVEDECRYMSVSLPTVFTLRAGSWRLLTSIFLARCRNGTELILYHC